MQGFPNSGKGWGEVKSPQWGGENQKFYCGRKEGGFFLPGEGNLSWVILTIWIFFKAKHSFLLMLNNQVKSKLTWRVCPKNMKLK